MGSNSIRVLLFLQLDGLAEQPGGEFTVLGIRYDGNWIPAALGYHLPILNQHPI